MEIYNHFFLSTDQGTTLVQQIKQQIGWLIANGRLKAGDQLPPVQVLAEHLGVNLHTVRKAYLRLAAEGLVESRQGRGTHVLPFDPVRLVQTTGLKRSHTVGVIVPSWTNPFYHALLQGIEGVAEEDQTLLFLCNTHDDPNTARVDVARLASKGVDGILMVSHDPGPFMTSGDQRATLPIVSIDWPASSGYSVQMDLQMAGFQAVQHLIDHGHRRIGLITFISDAENVTPVNAGYQQALENCDLLMDESLVARVPGFSMACGAEGARTLLKLENPPTAIFAIADMLALGAVKEIKATGLHIPKDIALVSFNDIPAAALIEPSLTTSAAPAVQMGREAMKMLRCLIEGRKPHQRRIVLPTSLIVRQSCGTHSIS